MLRELDERKLINTYARYVYNDEEDISNDIRIKENLILLLDWDKNGDYGLALYCSKFESLKRKDVEILTDIIKQNSGVIKLKAKEFVKERKLKNQKIILDSATKLEEKRKKHFCDENYEANAYGKPAKQTIYEGRLYKSRQECMYKEGITRNQLYQYLKKHERNKD